MKFSVVTPCRNSASHLPETIRSVVEQSALKLGLAELEYFIIDGASTAPKTRVALVGGVHANETLGNLTLEALVDWLLESARTAGIAE